METECHACIGGTNVRADIAKLELGQHVVVGTPGRVYDMIQRKALGIKQLELCGYIIILHVLLQILATSKCLCLTKLTKCCQEVSRIKFMMCLEKCPQPYRFVPIHTRVCVSNSASC